MKARIIVFSFVVCVLAMPAVAQTIVNSWPTGGTFAGGLDYASDTGTVWIADETAQLIMQFDRNGNLLTSFASPNTLPIGVGVDPVTGNIWIGDENEVVDEVTPAGVPTGRSFSTLPYIDDVSGLAVDPVTGNIYVGKDGSPQTIAEFAPDGTWIQSIDVSGSSAGDPDGLAYNHVTQTFLLGEDSADMIIEVDKTGTFLNSWNMGSLGISPEGLGVDTVAGTVFISDGFGNTVFEVSGIINPAGFLVDIKANGEDAGVIINVGSNVVLTINLIADDQAGIDHDVWVLAMVPSGNRFSYGTIPTAMWKRGWCTEYYSGPLTNISDTVLDSVLPTGSYKAWFGTDTDANGDLNIPAVFDSDMVDFMVVP